MSQMQQVANSVQLQMQQFPRNNADPTAQKIHQNVAPRYNLYDRPYIEASLKICGGSPNCS
jgi:hypothetical protein